MVQQTNHITFENIFTGETTALEIQEDFLFEPVPNVQTPPIIDERVVQKEKIE